MDQSVSSNSSKLLHYVNLMNKNGLHKTRRHRMPHKTCPHQRHGSKRQDDSWHSTEPMDQTGTSNSSQLLHYVNLLNKNGLHKTRRHRMSHKTCPHQRHGPKRQDDYQHSTEPEKNDLAEFQWHDNSYLDWFNWVNHREKLGDKWPEIDIRLKKQELARQCEKQEYENAKMMLYGDIDT